MGPHDQGEGQTLDRQPRWHVCGLGLASEDCPASPCLHFAVFEMGPQEGRMQCLMRTACHILYSLSWALTKVSDKQENPPIRCLWLSGEPHQECPSPLVRMRNE